jgi:chromosome segregation ATPase
MDRELIQMIVDGGVTAVFVLPVILLIARAPGLLERYQKIALDREAARERERQFEREAQERTVQTNDTMTATIRILNASLEDILRAHREWVARYGALEERMDEQTRQLEALRGDLAAKTLELVAARARITELEQQLEQVHADLRTKTDDLVAARKHIDELQEALQKEIGRRNELKAQRDGLEKKVKELEARVASLSQRVDDQEAAT